MNPLVILILLAFTLFAIPVQGDKYLTEAQKELLLKESRALESATKEGHAQNASKQNEQTNIVKQQSRPEKSRKTNSRYLGVISNHPTSHTSSVVNSVRTQKQDLQSVGNNADGGDLTNSTRFVQQDQRLANTAKRRNPDRQSRQVATITITTTTTNSTRSVQKDQRLANTAKRRNPDRQSRQVTTTTTTTNSNRSVQQGPKVAKTKEKFNWSGFFKGLGQVAEAINSGMNQTNSQYKRSNKIGQLNGNPYNPNSTSNPYGAGNPYNPNSINNPYGKYGSPYSNKSATNPYATNPPKLYDSHGNYRGKLSTNPYDPDSVSNPYGRYGNPYSPDSINNPYGAGNPYRPDSPNNPYGTGWMLIGD
jgi:hypothetical protein